MQLLLSQSELEHAIKNYVNELMNVHAGTELCIDLRAGRGVDGFTATVDIIKSGSVSPPKTVVPAATPGVIQNKATPRKEELAPQLTPIVELVAAEPVVAEKSEQQYAATDAKEETPTQTTSSVRRPLFGSLKKPE